MVRRRVLEAIAVIGLIMAPVGGAAAQGVITGSVSVVETGAPVGYAIVSIPSLLRQQLANDRGGFTIRDVPAGQVTLRFKRIGNVPRDTVVTLRDNDTLHVRIALATLIIKLPTVRVSGACGSKRPDASMAEVLASLFDQVTQNAEQYRVLAEANPFVMIVQRTVGYRYGDNLRLPIVDTIPQPGLSPTPYVPRQIVRWVGQRDVLGRSQPVLTVPELTDFADTAFINNHCFSYAGRKTIDRVPVLAVDYEPIPALDDEPDFRGTIFVAASGYRLVRSEMELTKVPEALRVLGVSGFHAETDFKEIIPGVTIIDRIEATTEFRRVRPRGEREQVISVQWAKGVECITSPAGCGS